MYRLFNCGYLPLLYNHNIYIIRHYVQYREISFFVAKPNSMYNMKSNFLRSLLALLCITGILTGCKKDKESDHDKKVKLITAKPWKITFLGSDANGDGTLDPNDLDENIIWGLDCMMDDNYTFKTDGSYTNDGYNNEAGGGCGIGSYTSTWELNANGVDFSYSMWDEGKLVTLNDSTLQFYVILDDGSKSFSIFKR